MNLESVYSLNPGSTLSSLAWSTRVLPIQVLGRKATRSAHKYNFETDSVELAKIRTCSFLNDMGAESKLSILPDIDTDPSRRTFPHAFHHVMEELRECWL